MGEVNFGKGTGSWEREPGPGAGAGAGAELAGSCAEDLQ